MRVRPKVEAVSARVLRRLFNAGRIHERAEAGEFEIRILKSGHPSPARSGQPFCTRSQMLAYHVPNGKRIALAHRYLRPDGTIGASGRPDPKRLLQDDKIFAVIEAEK